MLIIHQRDWIKNNSITFFSNSVRPLQEERLLFPGETPSRSVLLRKFDNLNELLESYILTKGWFSQCGNQNQRSSENSIPILLNTSQTHILGVTLKLSASAFIFDYLIFTSSRVISGVRKKQNSSYSWVSNSVKVTTLPTTPIFCLLKVKRLSTLLYAQ